VKTTVLSLFYHILLNLPSPAQYSLLQRNNSNPGFWPINILHWKLELIVKSATVATGSYAPFLWCSSTACKCYSAIYFLAYWGQRTHKHTLVYLCQLAPVPNRQWWEMEDMLGQNGPFISSWTPFCNRIHNPSKKLKDIHSVTW
jgi:hypothetical protein